MNKKSGYALRIVLGGYLTYLGIRILSEMIQQRPSNMTLMSVLAVVFLSWLELLMQGMPSAKRLKLISKSRLRR